MRVSTSQFLLQFYLQTYPDGSTRPRAFASRLVLCSPVGEVPNEAPCVAALARGFELYQGFVIDVGWLLHELPASTARQALSGAEELREAPQALPYDNVGKVFAEIFPIRELGFDTYAPQEQSYGRLEVSINTESIDERFENQSRRFLSVGLMLVLTLATGITLMYKSVTRELEQAHRMQNFVAAVTHELRTPISAIRLHGEMLLDGWAEAPGKRQEYYRRILRETARLSTLVERVLEKSRLKETRVEVREADLNAEVEASLEALERADGREDLRISLAPGLPRVWTTPDAVEGILSNLVENARKYAPMADGGEPILVTTRREDKAVLVEVADRGPGVPSSERDRIFEAFYRMGSEATRTATGTGLGLHLVRLHAEACGARASVLSREGGGSVFQVAFRPVG
jgi:signal transduction histidine kinase